MAMSYKAAKNLLAAGRKGRRRVGNNTYLYEVPEGIAVRLHATDVVIIRPDGTYRLDSGGWYTVTTKDRINEYSKARVYSEDSQWYLHVGQRYEDYEDAILSPLLGAAVSGEAPTFDWVVRWSSEGLDPAQAAWNAATSVTDMLFLAGVFPEGLRRRMSNAVRASRGPADFARMPDLIRQAVPTPPPFSYFTTERRKDITLRRAYYHLTSVPFVDGMLVGQDGWPVEEPASLAVCA